MPANNLDNWDQHWADFEGATDIAPSVTWRRRLLSRLLAIDPAGSGARVLEIGSGLGHFAEQFVAEYPSAAFLGLDLSAYGVQLAGVKAPKATFRQRNLLEPPGETDDLSFGATHAVCSEVLEHVDEPQVLLRNARPYMHERCRLVVTVPGGPMSAFHKHIGHRRHYTAESLRELLTAAGFQVEWASGVGFPFFNLYMALVVARGQKAIAEFSKKPSLLIRTAGSAFDLLFRLNSMRAGWQIAAICHPGASAAPAKGEPVAAPR